MSLIRKDVSETVADNQWVPRTRAVDIFPDIFMSVHQKKDREV